MQSARFIKLVKVRLLRALIGVVVCISPVRLVELALISLQVQTRAQNPDSLRVGVDLLLSGHLHGQVVLAGESVSGRGFLISLSKARGEIGQVWSAEKRLSGEDRRLALSICGDLVWVVWREVGWRLDGRGVESVFRVGVLGLVSWLVVCGLISVLVAV